MIEGLLAPFVDPASRTWVGALGISLLVAIVYCVATGQVRTLHRAFGFAVWRHRSSVVDVQILLFRQLLRMLGWIPQLGFAWGLATVLVRGLDAWWGQPDLVLAKNLVVALYSVVLFVTWDLSRYLLHRLMHHLPVLWAFHQVHHSAEVLTPLTYHRVHPVEGVLYDLRGSLVTGVVAGSFYWLFRDASVAATLMGVHAGGWVLNALTGNLRHSHVWMRFPAWLEKWFISPAQHQIHHTPNGCRVNYGTWLAVWDRWGHTLRLAGVDAPTEWGLHAVNHRQSLWSVLWGPLGAVPRLLPLAAGLMITLTAQAEDDPDASIVVTDDDGTPRVAGSAHVIDEETLERAELNDIHGIVQQVPGIYVRSEDGFGLRPNIGMRGGNSDRSAKITLLEDGIPLAPAPYAAPAAYYFPVVTRLTGVEVFKGAAAIQHGPQTIGGAINLRTRVIPQETAGGVDLAGGRFWSTKAHGWGGSRNERFGVLLEGTHLSSDGFKTLPDGGPTGFERQDLLFRGATYGPDRSLELKLGVGRERSNETYLGLTLDDYREDPFQRYAASQDALMTWQRGQAALTGQMQAGAWKLKATGYAHLLDRSWTKLNGFASGVDLHDLLLNPDGGQAAVYTAILRGEEDTATPDQALLVGTNDRRFTNGGVQLQAGVKHRGPTWSSDLDLGARIHVDDVHRLHTEIPHDMAAGVLTNPGDESTLLDVHTQARALAVYAHEDLGIRGVHLVPGVRVEVIETRYEQQSQTRTMGLPGLGVYGDVSDAVQLFAGVHRGFSPVAPGADPEEAPESAWTGEAGTRISHPSVNLELTGFASLYDNLTGQCTLSGGCDSTQLDQQFNGGQAQITGLEAMVQRPWLLPFGGELMANAQYTLTMASFQTGFTSDFPQFGIVEPGDVLPYVPMHQGSAGLSLVHDRGHVEVTGTAQGAMRDVAGQGEIPDAERIPEVVQLGANGSWQVSTRLQVYGTGTNLLGATPIASLRPFGARPMAPLQVMAGVKVDW